MNARLKPIDEERETLHTQLQIAHEQLDAARRRGNLEEYEHQFNRVKALKYELYGSTIRNTTMSREDREHYGDREEEREGASNGAIDWSRI